MHNNDFILSMTDSEIAAIDGGMTKTEAQQLGYDLMAWFLSNPLSSWILGGVGV